MKQYEIQGRRCGRDYGIYEVGFGPRGGRYTKKLIKKVPAYLKHTLSVLLENLNLGLG